MEPCWIDVAVDTPTHSGLSGSLLSYRSARPLQPGQLVRVPMGKRVVPAVVWQVHAQAPDGLDAASVREVADVLDAVAPLDAAWRDLVGFCARYYQRALGEVALAALPPALRSMNSARWPRRRLREPEATPPTDTPLALSPEQAQVLAQLAKADAPCVLFGNTGSGKTEVYLQAMAQVLAQDPQAQVLLMVPEINLTPQLQARVQARFGSAAMVSLHSDLTPAQRLQHWLAAHEGRARIVLGTRMAVLASMPHLRLILVDEEHDPSYKQQEGTRYSARDLAVYRGRLQGARVVLGSATPSLESWHQSRPAKADEAGGRYLRLHMPSRIGHAPLPVVRRIDMNHQPRRTLLSEPVLAALQARVARGEQSLILLNRRGWAPVLHCADCGWKSDCPHCSAFQVFHMADRSLRCHHCGAGRRVPPACPQCGNADISPMGLGTEQLQAQVEQLLGGVLRPDGQAVRVLRMDADSTRARGSLQTQLAQVHGGEVDVLLGTQMVAKGHDFRRMTLVVVLQPDTALFSSDFRAPERLLALLMQVAGRAGRDAAQAGQSEVLVQTFHPTHPVFEALRQHDWPAFAERELAERASAGLPPLSHQALLRADARELAVAQGLLDAVRAHWQAEQGERAQAGDGAAQALLEAVTLYPSVPMGLQKVAGVERAQMLLESASRPALQRVLAQLQPILHALRRTPAHKGVMRWLVDVDPQQI
jgi:primosomal protein N' (replication factor Y)